MDRHTRVLLGFGVAVAALLAVLVFALAVSDEGDLLLLPGTTLVATTPAESTSTQESVTEEPTTTSAEPTTTSAESTTTSTEPTTTSTEPTSTSVETEMSGKCADEESARPLPAGAHQQTLTVADLDGDGTDETMRIYRDGHWFVRVELANGYATEMVMDAIGVSRVVGVLTFGSDRVVLVQNRDLRDGQVGYGVFGFFDCDVRRGASDLMGDQLSVPVGERWVGGNLVAVDGLRCTADGFIHTKSRPAQSGPYEWVVSSVTYTWDAASRALIPGMEMSVALCCNRPDNDGLIFGSGGLDC